MIEEVLDRSKALDQLNRSFVADSRRAGNVIDGVAAQGHYIDNLLRTDTQNFLDLGRVANQIVLWGIQDADAVADELQHVLVAGDDVHGISRCHCLMRQRADYVVGFESRLFQNGNTVCLKRAPNVGKLLRQIVRHLLAISLVAAVSDLLVCLRFAVILLDRGDRLRLFITKRWRGNVKNSRKILGMKVIAQLVQHVHEDKCCRGRNPSACRHRALPLHGVVCPENKGHSVDQEDLRTGFGLWLRGQGLGKV